MSEEILAALIGAAATALLALLGHLAKRGRVIATITKWEHKLEKQDGEGGFVSCPIREETVLYSYVLELDLYNSSSDVKVVHDIKLNFRTHRRSVFSVTPIDVSTRRRVGDITVRDPVGIINLQPKTMSHMCLVGSIWKTDSKFSKLWDVDEIELCYSDESNRITKIPIEKDVQLLSG